MANKFGFEEAQPRDATQDGPKPQMISTASDTAESNVVSRASTNNMSQDEEEKAALVRRLR